MSTIIWCFILIIFLLSIHLYTLCEGHWCSIILQLISSKTLGTVTSFQGNYVVNKILYFLYVGGFFLCVSNFSKWRTGMNANWKKNWIVPVILHLFLPFWIHSLSCNIHRSLSQNYSTWCLLPYGVLLVSTKRRHYQEKKSKKTKLFGTDFCYISVSSLPTNDFDSGCVPHCMSTTVEQPISHSYSYNWVLK